MRRTLLIGMMAVAALNFSTAGCAQETHGTAEEAKAMLERAVPVMKANKGAAWAKFNKGEDGFKDRDLYVLCFDMPQGKITTAPANLLGKDIKDLKDNSGDAYGLRIYNAAIPTTGGQVSYKAPRQGSSQPVQQHMFVAKVLDQGCGVAYSDQ